LERVPVLLQACAEFLGTGVEDLEATRVHRRERRLTLDQMDRCAPLRSGLGEDQRCVVEFERGERYAPRGFLVPFEPAQPPGDHEVQFTRNSLPSSSNTMRLPIRRTP